MVEENVTTEEVTEESSDEQKTFDADYVKQLREEAKTYRKDKAALKKEYEEAKAKLTSLEAEKLTDVEKKEAKIAELEKQLTDIQSATKAKDIDNMVLKAISGKPIVDVEAAMLLIQKELASEDEVNDEVVTKIVENVLKAKPYLISTDKQNIGAGNFARQDNEPAKDPDRMLGEFLNS